MQAYMLNGWLVQAKPETVTAKRGDKAWQQPMAYRATFAGRDYWLCEYQSELWHSDRWAPYRCHCWLVLDHGGKVLAVGVSQHEAIKAVDTRQGISLAAAGRLGLRTSVRSKPPTF